MNIVPPRYSKSSWRETVNLYYAKVIRTEEIWIPVAAESADQARDIMEGTRGVVVVLDVTDVRPGELE